jgi:hypothetical protein
MVFIGMASLDENPEMEAAVRCFGAMVLGLAGFLVISSEHARAGSCLGVQSAPADMTKLKDAIDPDHQMGESTRNLAAIGALYQFKMNKGDTDGAACVAFRMIQHYRVASQKYEILAACASYSGAVDTTCRAAMKAYANFPDGKNFTVAKTPDGQLQFSFTDDHGNMISRGIEPADKLAAAAMGFAQAGFDKTLAAAAEPEMVFRAAGGRSPKKPKAMSDMPPIPPLDMPVERPRQPMNCVTMQLDSDIRTTNCN